MRRALPGEAAALTALALESKGHWGYPAHWLEQWRRELTVTPEYVRMNTVFVALEGEELLGFAGLAEESARWRLDHLWVRPAAIGRGVGATLFARALEEARARRPAPLYVESDPYALGFYERMGGRVVDEIPADMDGVRRSLPVLVFD